MFFLGGGDIKSISKGKNSVQTLSLCPLPTPVLQLGPCRLRHRVTLRDDCSCS